MIDRVDRFVLCVLALLLIAIGVVGLLAATGVLTVSDPSTLYSSLTQTTVTVTWWWIAAIALGVVLALLGLVLALRQLTRPGGPPLETVVIDRAKRGSTTVKARAVARAVEQDLARLPGVVGSRVQLLTDGTPVRLRAALDLRSDADINEIRSRAAQPLERATDSLGFDRVPTELWLRHTAQPPPRVR